MAKNNPTLIVRRDIAPSGWRWLEEYAFLGVTYVTG
jgi:hypothetical protein